MVVRMTSDNGIKQLVTYLISVSQNVEVMIRYASKVGDSEVATTRSKLF
jgi:hypothetical protein